MSWSRSLPALLGAAALSLGLGGCLQPMYSSMGGNLGAELRAIAVDPVPERLGHYLHDQLLTNFNGTGTTVPTKYRLNLTSNERVQTALVDTVTQRSQNASVVTDVTYTLYRLGSDKAIARGTVTSSAAYDRSEQRFANIRAARDAEIRDAKTLADQITNRVAAALINPRPLTLDDTSDAPKLPDVAMPDLSGAMPQSDVNVKN